MDDLSAVARLLSGNNDSVSLSSLSYVGKMLKLMTEVSF